MAQDLKPSTWIASWSENGTNVTFPIASVPELTAAEADADTGNISKVLFAICEKIYAEFNALAVADRPTKMRVYRGTSTNDQTGVTTKTFQFQFEVAITGQEVAEEESA